MEHCGKYHNHIFKKQNIWNFKFNQINAGKKAKFIHLKRPNHKAHHTKFKTKIKIINNDGDIELSDFNTDVIIVGAGLSGLACAKTLNDNNIKFALFEATDRSFQI